MLHTERVRARLHNTGGRKVQVREEVLQAEEKVEEQRTN